MAKQRETSGTTSKTGASDADNGVGWLAQGQSGASVLRAARAKAPDRKHDRDDSASATSTPVHLAASVAARQQVDLLSLDAVFDDEAAMFGAWDEALELPGIGPLLA